MSNILYELEINYDLAFASQNFDMIISKELVFFSINQSLTEVFYKPNYR